ncbi:cation:proton antiporter [uncultured Devosia sp.]|uniref:cation:proton antiporter n=1 Tax=uncultured Devosia sp. TaxID=211434 RepID=UPI0035CAFFE7
MNGEGALALAGYAGLALLGVALLLCVVRIVLGPKLADRVLALDLLTIEALGFVAILTVHTGYTVYLDIAIALGLLGFLATVALARYILVRATVNAARVNRESAS